MRTKILFFIPKCQRARISHIVAPNPNPNPPDPTQSSVHTQIWFPFIPFSRFRLSCHISQWTPGLRRNEKERKRIQLSGIARWIGLSPFFPTTKDGGRLNEKKNFPLFMPSFPQLDQETKNAGLRKNISIDPECVSFFGAFINPPPRNATRCHNGRCPVSDCPRSQEFGKFKKRNPCETVGWN